MSKKEYNKYTRIEIEPDELIIITCKDETFRVSAETDYGYRISDKHLRINTYKK